MELFTDGVIGDLLDDNLETANFDGKLWSNPTHVAEPVPVDS
jgi:carbonic anhydrase